MNQNEFMEFSFNCNDATPDELQWAIFDARIIIMGLNSRISALENNRPFIPVSECIHGGLYRLRARNFSLGVFNHSSYGFIGIREKFHREYLSTEFHHDVCRHHGTANPVKYLHEHIPEGVYLNESKRFGADAIWSTYLWGTDPVTGEERPAHRIDYMTDLATGKHGYRYYWADTGESVPEGVHTFSRQNQPLFDWLKQMEEKYKEEDT